MNGHHTTSPPGRHAASSLIPYDGDEWAGPHDRCSCGRQAIIVYLTERFGRVGFCAIPGARPLQSQRDDTLDTTHDGLRPPIRRTDSGR